MAREFAKGWAHENSIGGPPLPLVLGPLFEGSLFVGVSKGQPFRRQHTKAKWSPESGSLQLCRRQLGIRRLAAVLAPADRRLLVVLGGKPGELHGKKQTQFHHL